MVIVKELAWMKLYVDSVAPLLPKIKQIKKIAGRKAYPNKGQHFQGIIVYYDKKAYRICIYTTYKDRNDHDKVSEYSTIDLLGHLAHELAHLEHWDHTPDHKHLECVLLSAFMTKLKQEGYISEEEEAQNGLFYSR